MSAFLSFQINYSIVVYMDQGFYISKYTYALFLVGVFDFQILILE